MKTFLVTTDLSEESRAAFRTAAEYARLAQARILLLAVIEDADQAAMLYALDFPVEPDQDVREQFLKKVRTELEASAVEAFAGLACECVVLETHRPAAAEITDFCERRKADLIVMSSRGKSGLARLLTGSVTTKVMRDAAVPVLVVPV